MYSRIGKTPAHIEINCSYSCNIRGKEKNKQASAYIKYCESSSKLQLVT